MKVGKWNLSILPNCGFVGIGVCIYISFLFFFLLYSLFFMNQSWWLGSSSSSLIIPILICSGNEICDEEPWKVVGSCLVGELTSIHYSLFTGAERVWVNSKFLHYLYSVDIYLHLVTFDSTTIIKLSQTAIELTITYSSHFNSILFFDNLGV